MVLLRPQLWVVPGSHLQWRLAPWPGRARSDEPGPQEGSALTEGAFPAISEWLPDATRRNRSIGLGSYNCAHRPTPRIDVPHDTAS